MSGGESSRRSRQAMAWLPSRCTTVSRPAAGVEGHIVSGQAHGLLVAQRLLQRQRPGQQLAQLIAPERRTATSAGLSRISTVPSGRPSMAMGSAASSGKAVGKAPAGAQHGVAAHRPEGGQLGRRQHVQQRLLGHHLEAAVEAPVGAVPPIQHPEAVIGRRGHVERLKRHAGREDEPRRLPARVQIENQQPAAGHVADHQVVMPGHHHACQLTLTPALSHRERG